MFETRILSFFEVEIRVEFPNRALQTRLEILHNLNRHFHRILSRD
ncbi:MAG: hypothetical protein NTV37_03585 [Proteobacteria bacterium]|nr:hypothetical protein [Pseudomonadota bacterium]